MAANKSTFKIPCISDMQDRVAIYTRTIVRAATGDTETWTLAETLWMQVLNLSTSKKIWLGSFFKDVSHIIYARGHLTYTLEGTKFIFNSKTYFMVTPGEYSDTMQPEFTKYIIREDIS